MRLLLISNAGTPPFEHCQEEIASFIRPDRCVAFVTAARLENEDEYFALALRQLVDSGALPQLVHLTWHEGWQETLDKADDVFVGGGNTYALLKRLTESGLLDAIREKVKRGAAYIGSSAGANLAGPNIQTTNDWNVVGHTSFSALGVVPFNVNPHYIERGNAEGPTGESRSDRIAEYLAVHDNPVLALEEGALVNVDEGTATLLGTARARLFARDLEPRWLKPGDRLELADL